MSPPVLAQNFSFDHIFASYPMTARKIIKAIPQHLRFDVGAINFPFYETVCDIDKKKYAIRINGESHGENFLNDNVVSSILNSDREFDELQLLHLTLNAQNLKKLLKIAKKHGEGMLKLQMERCSIDFHSLYQLFGKLPLLEHFEVLIDAQNLPPADFQPVLKNLKRLDVTITKYDALFCTDLIASHTLESFSFKGYGLTNFSSFFQRQSKIKFMEIVCMEYGLDNAENFKHMRDLEEVKLNFGCNSFVQELIRDHPTLKKLSISGSILNERTLSTMYNHAIQLQAFNICVNDNNCTRLLELPCMRNLMEIEVLFQWNFNKFDIFEAFSKLSMTNVKKLKLNAIWKISCNNFDITGVLENFGRHWKNIEELEFNASAYVPDHLQHCHHVEIDRILKSFQKLKTLKLSDPFKTERDEKYPKVQELKLTQSRASHLLNIVSSLPNLTKLEISNCIENQMNEKMLNLFQSLASHDELKNLGMTLYCEESPIINDYINALKKLCRRLPKFFITLEARDKSFLDKIESSFDENFCKTLKQQQGFCHQLQLMNFNY